MKKKKKRKLENISCFHFLLWLNENYVKIDRGH